MSKRRILHHCTLGRHSAVLYSAYPWTLKAEPLLRLTSRQDIKFHNFLHRGHSGEGYIRAPQALTQKQTEMMMRLVTAYKIGIVHELFNLCFVLL